MTEYIDIVFDEVPNQPAPTLVFVEVEDDKEASISFGSWVLREDGHHVLRIPQDASATGFVSGATTALEIVIDAIDEVYRATQTADDGQPFSDLADVINSRVGELINQYGGEPNDQP